MKPYALLIAVILLVSLSAFPGIPEATSTPFERCLVLYGDTDSEYLCDELRTGE